MPRSLLIFCFCLFAAASGCKGPLKTQAKVTMHTGVVQDLGPLTEMPVQDVPWECDRIALIDIDGILVNAPLTGFGSLGENPVSLFREKLDQVARDPSYRAVVLRINSHGGGVTASDIMWRDLQDFKARTGLPVVACLMDVGAGGAYYVALGADQIVAHPTSIVGGVGVILNLYNLQDTLMQFNILGNPIKAGEHIDVGSPLEGMEDGSREILQRIADEYHARFRQLVVQHRGLAPDAAEMALDGRILLAGEAAQLYLIDSVGYLDDAIEMARQMGGCPDAGVVMLHRHDDRARTPYAVSPNSPLQTGILPLSLPGLERTRMPTFLYLWQPEPTYFRRATGR